MCMLCMLCKVCVVCMVFVVCMVCMVCIDTYHCALHLVNVHDHTACAHCAEIVHNHARQKQHMNSDPNELQPATC